MKLKGYSVIDTDYGFTGDGSEDEYLNDLFDNEDD
jgi:hypothetical protein